MSMQAVFDIQKPDKVNMRLTAIMPMEDWKKVRAFYAENPTTLDHWHPAMQLIRAIDDMVNKAEKEFYFYGEEKPAV